MASYYLAVDIGASSGRHILGTLENGKLHLEEVYRFENGMQEKEGHLCWDHSYLVAEIKNGMKRCKELGKIPKSVGIDTWGVDFVLLDENGAQLGDSVGYRDHRTDHVREKLDAVISQRELYARTGIQFQLYNTLNQLLVLKEEHPKQLAKAKALLMTPDYFNYCLTGKLHQEYTIASTSQLLSLETGNWDYELIERLALPREIFLPVERPGSVSESLSEAVAEEVGFSCEVTLIASHDTASAVMAVPSLSDTALYISSGTWSLMGCESRESSNSGESMDGGFTNEGGYDFRYRYLKNIMGLWMIQSVRKEIGEGKSYGQICKEASEIKIASIVDCDDACFLSPESMVTAVQDYCRNTRQQVPVTLPEIASVIYNSLAKCYADTKQRIEKLTGNTFDRIYIIGGGSQADYLNELTAKYAQCKVSAGPTEATAIGNLLAQMIRDGELKDLQEARKCVMESFELMLYNN